MRLPSPPRVPPLVKRAAVAGILGTLSCARQAARIGAVRIGPVRIGPAIADVSQRVLACDEPPKAAVPIEPVRIGPPPPPDPEEWEKRKLHRKQPPRIGPPPRRDKQPELEKPDPDRDIRIGPPEQDLPGPAAGFYYPGRMRTAALDDDCNPVANTSLTVSLSGYEFVVTTDSEGWFTIDGTSDVIGQKLVITAPEYEPVERQFAPGDGDMRINLRRRSK